MRMMVAGSVLWAPSWLRSAGSSPRLNNVPKIDLLMSYQFNAAALRSSVISITGSSETSTFFKQAAVELRNFVVAIQLAFTHHGEQVARACGEFVVGELAVVNQAFKHTARQQARVFGKKAEHALREKVSHLVGTGLKCLLEKGAVGASGVRRWFPFRSPAVGERGKTFGSGLGDVAAGFLRPETFGVKPDAAQQRELFGLVQLAEQHVIRFGRVAVEQGADAGRQAVSHPRNRRVAERLAVLLQVPQRGNQVFAERHVLLRKHAASEDIGVPGAPAAYTFFIFKQIPVFAAGLWHTQQLARIKMALRALLFA